MKIHELIRAVEGARTALVDLENLSDEELARLQEAFHRLGVPQSDPIQAMCEQVEQVQAECEATAAAGANGRQREKG